MPIRNFEKGYTLNIVEKTFDELKFSYRSTTSYIFKSIHENKKIDLHLRNKIKMRLFCCHMINRIFIRKEIPNNFPHFISWLKTKGIKWEPIVQGGFGAAMAGYRKATEERRAAIEEIFPLG